MQAINTVGYNALSPDTRTPLTFAQRFPLICEDAESNVSQVFTVSLLWSGHQSQESGRVMLISCLIRTFGNPDQGFTFR